MRILDLLIGCTLILLSSISGCDTKQDVDCGYNGETIQVLNNQNALVRDLGEQFFLHFEVGLVTGSQHLQDTIYLLLPCNLSVQHKLNNLKVIVSGEIKENPGYSSHTNYTDFHITKIMKAST